MTPEAMQASVQDIVSRSVPYDIGGAASLSGPHAIAPYVLNAAAR